MDKVRNIGSTRDRLRQFVRGSAALFRYLLSHHPRELVVVVCLAAVLVLPFILREAVGSVERPPRDGDRLVILTPHNATIRREFGEAFTRHMRENYAKEVYVDWRNPGGTSEIARVIDSEFEAAFELFWHREERGIWGKTVAEAFDDRRLLPAQEGEKETSAQAARRLFLASDVGIGVDLFFGGGTYDFRNQAEQGHLVAKDARGSFGISPLLAEKPEWFEEKVFPASFSGERYRDSDARWIGTCLSSFGICYNRDGLRRLGILESPSAWEDLADPRLFGEVALADPTKSGSIAKAFEMLIQQEIAIAFEREVARVGLADLELSDEEVAREARASGWRNGLRLIQRIAANARYFTDSSSRIPLDVAQGNASVGMCIDFYGRTFVDQVAEREGISRVGFAIPVGGTSSGADPIAMFRGAPRPDLAHAFLRFVVSPEGQRLWNFRVGAPGGPSRTSLRRLPVRRDAYLPEELAYFTDPEDLPYQRGDFFTYRPEWTAESFEAIRFIIGIMCVNTHNELRDAWRAIAQAGIPDEALEVFEDLGMVNYELANGGISEVLDGGSRLEEVRLARDLSDYFRGQYRRAERLARKARPLPKKNQSTRS